MSFEKDSFGLGRTADTAGQWKATVYFGVLMAIAAGLCQQPSAFAQKNAAQTAAGAIIIQNNQMRQELRETRRELKEIKEGLGIEEPSSQSSEPLPMGLAVLAGVILVGGCFVLAVVAAPIAGTRESTQYQYKWFLGIPLMIAVMCGVPLLMAVLPKEQRDQYIGPLSLALFGGMFAAPVAAHYLGGWAYDRRQSPPIIAKKTMIKPVGNEGCWYVRLPNGDVNGPREKENIRVMATQGKYPPGTQWSNFETGPWDVLVEPKTSPEQSTRYWVRTPQGMSGGPYTKEQLSRAIAAGKIPDGSEAASSPDGPWRKIATKRS